jgi:transposase
LEAVLGERMGVWDEEWALIGPLLPPERGRDCRPAQDNRRYFKGMMWIARTGTQWRHLPDEYGKWNSVFRRYRRWVTTGVLEAMLETLAELAGCDLAAGMIDSTVFRAHHCAVGLTGGLSKPRPWPIARRLHHQAPHEMRRQGLPLGFVLTPGQSHDVQGFAPLFRMIEDRIEAFSPIAAMMRTPSVKRLPLAASRRSSRQRAIATNSVPHDRTNYRWRNLLERLSSC